MWPGFEVGTLKWEWGWVGWGGVGEGVVGTPETGPSQSLKNVSGIRDTERRDLGSQVRGSGKEGVRLLRLEGRRRRGSWVLRLGGRGRRIPNPSRPGEWSDVGPISTPTTQDFYLVSGLPRPSRTSGTEVHRLGETDGMGRSWSSL